jgi:hypothetical protein
MNGNTMGIVVVAALAARPRRAMNNPSTYRHCNAHMQQLRFQRNSEGGVMVHRAILIAILASAAGFLPRLARLGCAVVGGHFLPVSRHFFVPTTPPLHRCLGR